MYNRERLELDNILSRHYRIGELVDYEKDTLGLYNVSYSIDTVDRGKTGRYFLRKYRKGRKEAEIRFEHSLINHLVEKNFDIVAPIVNTRTGDTYVKTTGEKSNGNKGADVFYTVFDYIDGDVSHVYENPDCSDRVLRNVASVLARFHESVVDLEPVGRRYEPDIAELLPGIRKNLDSCICKQDRLDFNDYLSQNKEIVYRAIERTGQFIQGREYDNMLRLVIHGDYHPGNLKFKGDRIVGLFDFDWSKYETRCYDVALALILFCTDWENDTDGELQLGKAMTFLNAYQNTLRNSEDLTPLSELELDYLPEMISASNIYLVNWLANDYCIDPEEYLRYLQHTINIMKWLEDRHNLHKLEKLTMMIDTRSCQATHRFIIPKGVNDIQ